MNDESIQVEIDIRELVTVNVDAGEIIHAINSMHLTKKWGIIGNILTHVRLTGKDEHGDDLEVSELLTDEQKELVRKFLNKQLSLL